MIDNNKTERQPKKPKTTMPRLDALIATSEDASLILDLDLSKQESAREVCINALLCCASDSSVPAHVIRHFPELNSYLNSNEGAADAAGASEQLVENSTNWEDFDDLPSSLRDDKEFMLVWQQHRYCTYEKLSVELRKNDEIKNAFTNSLPSGFRDHPEFYSQSAFSGMDLLNLDFDMLSREQVLTILRTSGAVDFDEFILKCHQSSSNFNLLDGEVLDACGKNHVIFWTNNKEFEEIGLLDFLAKNYDIWFNCLKHCQYSIFEDYDMAFPQLDTYFTKLFEDNDLTVLTKLHELGTAKQCDLPEGVLEIIQEVLQIEFEDSFLLIDLKI
jgi:hypothetical protein